MPRENVGSVPEFNVFFCLIATSRVILSWMLFIVNISAYKYQCNVRGFHKFPFSFRYLLCKKQKRNRCNTCTGQQATSMSLVSSKRQQSINRRPTISINRKVANNAQETAITLLGNGHGDSHICNKII